VFLWSISSRSSQDSSEHTTIISSTNLPTKFQSS
jgi:hypothetical protein